MVQAMRTRKGTRFDNTRDVWDERLEQYIKFINRDNETFEELYKRLQNRIGILLPKSQVRRWLEPDRKRRIHPLVGTGLVILEEIKRLYGEYEAEGRLSGTRLR